LAGFELTTHGRIWVTPEVVLTILVSQNRVSPLLEKGCLCRGRTLHDGCEQLGTNRNPHALANYVDPEFLFRKLHHEGGVAFSCSAGITAADLLAVEEGEGKEESAKLSSITA
jgi:hypothetical protein